jgi:hypothetical protein
MEEHSGTSNVARQAAQRLTTLVLLGLLSCAHTESKHGHG